MLASLADAEPTTMPVNETETRRSFMNDNYSKLGMALLILWIATSVVAGLVLLRQKSVLLGELSLLAPVLVLVWAKMA